MIFFPFGPVFACKLFTFAWNISTFSDVKANRKNIETTTLNSKCFVGELRWLLNCPTTYFVVNSHFVCNDSTECVACFTLIQRFIISVVDLRAAFFGHFFFVVVVFFGLNSTPNTNNRISRTKNYMRSYTTNNSQVHQ